MSGARVVRQPAKRNGHCLSEASLAIPAGCRATREISLAGVPFLLVRFLWARKENEQGKWGKNLHFQPYRSENAHLCIRVEGLVWYYAFFDTATKTAMTAANTPNRTVTSAPINNLDCSLTSRTSSRNDLTSSFCKRTRS